MSKDPFMIYHFYGGVRGYRPHGTDVFIEPVLPRTEQVVVSVKDCIPGQKLTDIFGCIVGVEWIDNRLQAKGLLPTWWSINHYNPVGLSRELSEKLSQIRSSAFEQSRFELYESVNKLQSWLDATIRAFKRLSNSYHSVLSIRCVSGQFKGDAPFTDMNCDSVFDSMHNFLYYIGTLRDHISEFIVLHIAKGMPAKLKDDPKMVNLKNTLKKNIDSYGIESLKQHILDAYDTKSDSDWPGWLYILGRYRNIITHERPIQMFNHHAWLFQQMKNIQGVEYPRLKFPIPGHPFMFDFEIPRGHSDLDTKRKMVAPNKESMRKDPDGMEYCWMVFDRLMRFLSSVVSLSPIEPKIQLIVPHGPVTFGTI